MQMTGGWWVEDAPEGTAESGCHSPAKTPTPGLSSATKPLSGNQKPRAKPGNATETPKLGAEPSIVLHYLALSLNPLLEVGN